MPQYDWRNALKNARKKSGLSQSDVAFRMNKTQQTIANWEAGKAAPGVDELIELTNIIGISLAELFEKVHLSLKEDSSEKTQKNTPNSTPNGTPNSDKGTSFAIPNIAFMLDEVVNAKNAVIETQKSFIESLNQRVKELSEENERLKRAIPELPQAMEDRSVKKSAG